MTDLSLLQQHLRYRFRDEATLRQALTHTSYGHEHFAKQPISLRDNERLEFLGDAILDLVVSDVLLERFPECNEGQLSKMRAAAVNEKTLADLARTLTLNESVRLGKGELQTGGRDKPSILSSTFEAVIAAIYLDGGYEAVFPVVREMFEPLFVTGHKDFLSNDHKTRLQEIMQARHKQTPSYHLVAATGPDHSKVFEVEVRMGNRALAVASGSSKKQAEQNAARAALETSPGANA